jgi:hypothetical protein
VSESTRSSCQARMTGRRDPRFLATYAGMLFMGGRYAEAKAVIDEAKSRDFAFRQRRTLHFEPHPGGTDVWLAGTVESLLASFAFIRVPGFPQDFYLSTSRYGDIEMRPGLSIRFRPGFNLEGPIVLDPRLPD